MKARYLRSKVVHKEWGRGKGGQGERDRGKV